MVNAAEKGQNWQKETIKVEADIISEIIATWATEVILIQSGIEAPSVVVVIAGGVVASAMMYGIEEFLFQPIIEKYIR